MAAVAVALAGWLPELSELWWGEGRGGGVDGGDHGTRREREREELAAKKWRVRNAVRGGMILVGGVLVGGWAVWI